MVRHNSSSNMAYAHITHKRDIKNILYGFFFLPKALFATRHTRNFTLLWNFLHYFANLMCVFWKIILWTLKTFQNSFNLLRSYFLTHDTWNVISTKPQCNQKNFRTFSYKIFPFPLLNVVVICQKTYQVWQTVKINQTWTQPSFLDSFWHGNVEIFLSYLKKDKFQKREQIFCWHVGKYLMQYQ